MRVHFMGIGGSGVSAVVQLAQAAGFDVSGCDLVTDTPYIDKVKKAGISVLAGHDPKHLDDVDLVAASPAAFFQKPLHPELAAAIAAKKALTWQAFLGQYLQTDKQVIGIAGTHGKSTTTAMTSLMFEAAGLDPLVMIGATVPSWNNNCRLGKGRPFVIEADEFFDNFLNYSPDTVILNNIEPDHPDYFKTQKQLYQSFSAFIGRLQGPKNLIFNQDSPGVRRLFRLLGDNLNGVNLIGYTLGRPLVDTNKSYLGTAIRHSPAGTIFNVLTDDISEEFQLEIPGNYNVSNALGVIALGRLYQIPTRVIQDSLRSFGGIGRRLELLGKPGGVYVYDDYAHHPTAIKLTLEALKQRHPQSRIVCVVEPHSFSRTKQLLTWYKNAFAAADTVVIAPIFKARDKSTFGISQESIVTVANHPEISALEFDQIPSAVKSLVRPEDVVVVMGAGLSYQLAREIKDAL